MFGFSKKVFIATIGFIGLNMAIAIPLKCVSMNNQNCNVRPAMVNINSNEPLFYSYSVAKSMNIKVFNLMSRTNETRYVSCHETCACKCRLYASVCNDKQRSYSNKYRCECKELIDKGRSNDRFIWNSSIPECECQKSCDVGESLYYANYKSRKKLIDRLVEEYNENIDGKKWLIMRL